MDFENNPRAGTFTQGCRDFIRTFTYEDIFACTVYAPPMLFMLGPAAVVGQDRIMTVLLHSLLGFGLAAMFHGVGHRLLVRLPQAPQRIYLFRGACLPVKLTLSQFLWLLESLVGLAVFSGVLGRHFFSAGTMGQAAMSVGFFTLGLGLFFAPVALSRCWIQRYYPAMPLVGPTDEVINRSVPSLRSFFK